MKITKKKERNRKKKRKQKRDCKQFSSQKYYYSHSQSIHENGFLLQPCLSLYCLMVSSYQLHTTSFAIRDFAICDIINLVRSTDIFNRNIVSLSISSRPKATLSCIRRVQCDLLKIILFTESQTCLSYAWCLECSNANANVN